MTNQGRKRSRSCEEVYAKKRLRTRRSKDPLIVLPNELHELVFHHLSGNDVLNASEVSRLWYQETVDSKSCAKTFRINIDDIFELPERSDLKQLQHSPRRYQHIHIRWDYLGSNNNECWNVIKAHSQDIKTLSIANLMMADNSETTLVFPKLKKLTILHQINWLYNPTYVLLKANNNLTCLVLDVDFDTRMCDFFEQNQTLKELELSSNLMLSLLLMDALNDVKFKLTKLKISRSIFSFMDNNFNTFLTSQADSLEEIEVFGVPTEVFNLIFNDFKAIRVLNIKRIYNFYYINVHPNETLRTFTSDLPLEGLAPIIIAATNLEVLQVHILETEMMEFISRNARNLKTLLFKLKTGDVYEHYKNLKTQTTNLNNNIEVSEVLY